MRTLTVNELHEMINTAVLVRTVHLEDQITELRRMVNDLTIALGMVNGDIEEVRADMCKLDEDDVNNLIERYIDDCCFVTANECVERSDVLEIVDDRLDDYVKRTDLVHAIMNI